MGLETAIKMTGIVKKFPGVIANDHVNLDINFGEVHALLEHRVVEGTEHPEIAACCLCIGAHFRMSAEEQAKHRARLCGREGDACGVRL